MSYPQQPPGEQPGAQPGAQPGTEHGAPGYGPPPGQPYGQPDYGPPPGQQYGQPYGQPYGAAPVYAGGHAPGTGPLGQVRGTGTCILLCIVTLGIYSLVWYYKVHDEMKRHSGQGLGGGVALLLALLVSIAMVFVTPSEIGTLRERAGLERRVSAVTGFWNLIPLVGAIVWFVKTNGALNDYWLSQGATA